MLGSVQAPSAHQDSGSAATSVLCPTSGQRFATDAFGAALDQRQPLIVVYGDSGSGKTTLLNCVLDTVDPQEFAVLAFSATSGEFSSPPSFDNVLEAMCRRLDAPQSGKQRPKTLSALSETVGALMDAGKTLILAIDHADFLADTVITDVARLAEHLDMPPNRLVRVFVGSMELASRIDSALRGLGIDQRPAEVRLSQPSAEEVAALLAYEDSAQFGGPMLTPGAIDRINAYAKSNLHWAVPMADAARALAENEGMPEVTPELVRSAFHDIWSPERTVSAESDLREQGPAFAGNLGTREPTRPRDQRAKTNPAAASKPAWQFWIERLTPVLAVLLFIIASVPLVLKDELIEQEDVDFRDIVGGTGDAQPAEPSDSGQDWQQERSQSPGDDTGGQMTAPASGKWIQQR